MRWFSVCEHAVTCTPAGSLGYVAHGSAYSNRSPLPNDGGLPQITVGSAPASQVSRPAQRSLGLQPADLPSRLLRPSTSEAPAALLPPPPLRLLPGGAIQFPGESFFSLRTSAFSRRTVIVLSVTGITHKKGSGPGGHEAAGTPGGVVFTQIEIETTDGVNPETSGRSRDRRKLYSFLASHSGDPPLWCASLREVTY